MQIYKVFATEHKHGVVLNQSEFDITIDADTIEHGLHAMKNQIEQEGVLKMRSNEPVPESKIDMDFVDPNSKAIFIQVDIEKKFRDSATESVRKNISMPAWMDIQLRYHNVDASKLFQDAAVAYLEQQTNKTECKQITTLDELKANVDKDLLNQYVMSLLKQ